MSYLIGTHQATLHSLNRYYDISTIKARFPSENPTIPSPSVFAGLDEAGEDQIPTTAQCAVHLELLEAFHALKVRVVGSSDLDRTFGLAPKTKTVYRRKYSSKLRKYINQSAKVKDPDWEARRRQKWPRYLDFAAERFVDWAKKIDTFMAEESRVSSDGVQTSKSHQVRLPYVPPLDILIVWHAFLLNPSSWHNYCEVYSLNHLVGVPFPWRAIHDCIESQGTISQCWAFSLPDRDCQYLKDNEIEANLCDYLENLGKPASPEPPPDEASKGTEEPASPESPQNEASEDSQPVAAVSIESPLDQSDLLKSLIANVTRQLVFVDKMHAHLWIRSPALAGTLTRAVERYENFLELFQLHPGKMLVPTLDIDLAWHTHQLSAKNYKAVTETRCGRFINHNDKLGKPTLNTGMKDTQELFQVHFGQAYSTCNCWDCESIATALEAYDEDDTALTDGLTDKVSKEVLRNVQHYRAVEHARRKGDILLPILL